MSAALDRILQAVNARRLWPNVGTPLQSAHDDSHDDSLALGDWKDGINRELHALKRALTEIADMLDDIVDDPAMASVERLRALAKDL